MASSGPNSPSTAVDDTSAGSVSATNKNNVFAQDTNYCLAGSSNQESYYIKTTGYGFSIPSGATIDGIKVEVRCATMQAAYYGYGRTPKVKLVKGDTISGSDRGDGFSGAKWPVNSAFAYMSYGGSSDLWGLSWTDTDINASNFGTAITIARYPYKGGSYFLDHIRITVYYTTGGSGSVSQKIFQTRQAINRASTY